MSGSKLIISRRGFSLIGVLVAIGLAGLLAVVLSNIFKNSMQAQNTVTQSSDFTDLSSQVQLLIDSQCDTNFQGQTLPASGDLPVAVLEQKSPTSPAITVLSTGQIFGRIKLMSMALKLDPTLIPTSGIASVVGSLQISAKKDRGSANRNSFGGQDITKNIPVGITINAARSILSCGNSVITIPQGAVMAFNLATCPVGWSVFTPANGRNIIGTGSSGTLGAVNHVLLQSGGEEKHNMLANEVAPHTHGYSTLTRGSDTPKGTGSNTNRINDGMSALTTTVNAGGGQPMAVMDPYVALLYCEKN